MRKTRLFFVCASAHGRACSPDACMLRMLRLLLAQNPSFFRVRFRARPGLQPGCLHASHAAAFACAKPVFFFVCASAHGRACSPDACMLAHAAAFACAKPGYFRVRFRARPGLQPGLEPRSCRNGNERLAKGGKPVFAATGRFSRKTFLLRKLRSKFFLSF